jgi:hypothetical protein
MNTIPRNIATFTTLYNAAVIDIFLRERGFTMSRCAADGVVWRNQLDWVLLYAEYMLTLSRDFDFAQKLSSILSRARSDKEIVNFDDTTVAQAVDQILSENG